MYADRVIEYEGKVVEDTLQMFIKSNPYAVRVNILSEGTAAYFCADENNMFVHLSVAEPQLFMRMLMQGLTLYVDPTGSEKEKYTLLFPSAADVQDMMGAFQPLRSSEFGDSKQSRPDISPLLKEMNKYGVTYKADSNAVVLGEARSMIELEPEKETLNYYALIPKAQLMADKELSPEWAVGLFLDTPPADVEDDRQNMGIRDQRPPQMQSRNTDAEKLMKKRIYVWGKFLIDDVNTINLQ